LSSILRALKKLENEPRHLEETPVLGSKFVPLADTGRQKTWKGILIPVLGGAIVCGLVILSGWWLFSEKNQPPPPDVPQIITRPGPQQAQTVPAAPMEADTPAPAAADSLPGAPPVKVVAPSAPALEQRTDMPGAERAAAAAIQVPAAQPETIKQVAPEAEDVAGVRGPEPSIKFTESEIPLLNDPEMKLQAITWSKDPQKRIAVINNRILRQGERVYGYHIDAINQDDVVLSDAGEKWKLLFRIK